jgi:hypothetical protein
MRESILAQLLLARTDVGISGAGRTFRALVGGAMPAISTEKTPQPTGTGVADQDRRRDNLDGAPGI